MRFDAHTTRSAPEASRSVLESTERKIGFVPNLLGVLAESPAALQAYSNLSSALQHNADLSAAEQQVIFLTVSLRNRCGYCMAAHSGIASNGVLTNDQIDSLRHGRALDDDRLEALQSFVGHVVDQRGRVGEKEVHAFLEAGYKQRHILDIIAAVALKTLTNYANNLNATDLDEAFEPFRWEPGTPA